MVRNKIIPKATQKKSNPRIVLYAVLVLAFIAIVFALKNMPLSFLRGDITGTGLDTSAKEPLRNWLVDQEHKDPSLYTFTLIDTREGKKIYMVECKKDLASPCEKEILMAEVNEATGAVMRTERLRP